MKDLENIFQKRLGQLGLKKRVDAAMIVEESQNILKEIFGKNIEDKIKVISFNKGVLKIGVKNNAWAAEIQGHQNKLVREPIKNIKFSVLEKEIEE